MNRASSLNASRALTRWSLGIPAEVGLIALFSLLFALSFPGFASVDGWFPVAFIALAPLWVLLRSATWPRAVVYGPITGFLSYALFNYWLAKFHPITIFVVPPIHAVYFLALLPALKLADELYPRAGFLVQVVVWVGYEYLKTQGFLGYPWGVLGYSQYTFLPLIGVARLGGVWLVSLLVALPSAVLAAALLRRVTADRAQLTRPPAVLLNAAAVGCVLLLLGAVVYTRTTRVDVGDRTVRLALVQQNADPWKTQYKQTLDTLIDLSDRALQQNPDMVIWSETSFVPAIDYHRRYREDQERYALVRRLLDYLDRQTVPFVVGNDDGQRRRDASGRDIRVDYNAAIVFQGQRILDTYRKLHLVPFTENFPFERTLPGLYRFLADNPDIHLWEKGVEPTVFEAAGVRFSTPICFEDSFGYLSRLFVSNGAELIVNMTNDAWSKSVPAQMQHLAMAVFRAVENARTVVRSTNSGMTVAIDPNGKIVAEVDPFVPAFIVTDVPVPTGTTTPYTLWGDWLGVGALGAGLLLLLSAAAVRLARRLGAARSRGR